MKSFFVIGKDIFQTLKGYYSKILFLIFLSFITVLLSLFIAVVNQMTLDQVFYAKNIGFLFSKMIYVFIFIYLASLFFSVVSSYYSSKLYSQTDSLFKIRYYDSIIHSSYYFNSTHQDSDIYYRMFKDITFVIEYYLNISINIPTKTVYLICAIGLMFNWSMSLALIYIILLFLEIASLILARKPTYNISMNQRKVEQEIITKVSNDFKHVTTIKIFGIEILSLNKMQKNFEKYIKADIKNKFLLSIIAVFSNLSTQIWSLTSIIVGAIQVYNGTLSIGAFVSLSAVASMATSHATSLLSYIFTFQATKVSYQRYKEYSLQQDPAEYNGNKKFTFENTFRLNNLTFQYFHSDQVILNNINFEARPGEIVAVIGENGAGKSTLANLIGRIISPEDSKITIDSNDIKEIAYYEYRANVGYCQQKPIIFNISLKDNILLGQKGISDNEIDNVLESLKMNTLIDTLPDKLETVIGENGYKLSVGNMQKIAVARVLIRKYKILILDEPTASMDVLSQKSFFDAIRNYVKRNNTLVFIITHSQEEENFSDKVLKI